MRPQAPARRKSGGAAWAKKRGQSPSVASCRRNQADKLRSILSNLAKHAAARLTLHFWHVFPPHPAQVALCALPIVRFHTLGKSVPDEARNSIMLMRDRRKTVTQRCGTQQRDNLEAVEGRKVLNP